MENISIKVWHGYTIRGGGGFAQIGKHSAHLKQAEITVRELNEDEMGDAGDKFLIRIPTSLIGGVYSYEEQKSIRCKSLGHAKHIIQSQKPLKVAAADGWYLSPELAAADAYEALVQRTNETNLRRSIREVLQERGLSKTDLSKKSGVAYSTLDNYLKRGTAIGSEKLEKILNALGLSIQ